MASRPAITVWVCSRSKMKKKDTKQRDLPKRTGPFYLYRVIFIPRQLPARRLILRLICWFSMIYVWTGQHLGCNFRAFCTFCTLMSRNISQEYSFFCKIFVLFAGIFIYVIKSVFIQPLILGLLLILVNNLVNILPDHFHCSCITYSGRGITPKAHSANFVCKVNDFFWLYVHSARFSCRTCMILIYIKVETTFCYQIIVSIKRKMDGI